MTSRTRVEHSSASDGFHLKAPGPCLTSIVNRPASSPGGSLPTRSACIRGRCCRQCLATSRRVREPEFWNVLWQRYRQGELSLDDVKDYWDAFEESPLLFGEVLPLMPVATEIATRSECIIYDALFVALAESEDTVVVTADGKLLKALEGTPYAKRGVHLKAMTDAHLRSLQRR